MVMFQKNDFKAHVEEIVTAAEGGQTTRDPEVVQSWLRCINEYSLDPEHKGQARIVSEAVLREHQQEAEDLLSIARFGMEDLYRRVDSMGYVLLLTDAKGVTVDFIGDENVCLILGDNLFFNTEVLYENNLKKRCKIFIKKVKNPNNYGVIEEKKGVVYKIHEKPKRFISNYVVVGIYMFTNSVVKYVKKLKPSKRGEIEITDLNNIYINNNSCEVVLLENDSIWFDSGTFDSLVDASNFVRKNGL